MCGLVCGFVNPITRDALSRKHVQSRYVFSKNGAGIGREAAVEKRQRTTVRALSEFNASESSAITVLLLAASL